MPFDSGINMQVCSYLAMHGMQFPLPKNKKKITKYDIDSEKACKSWQLKEGYRLYMEQSESRHWCIW